MVISISQAGERTRDLAEGEGRLGAGLADGEGRLGALGRDPPEGRAPPPGRPPPGRANRLTGWHITPMTETTRTGPTHVRIFISDSLFICLIVCSQFY